MTAPLRAERFVNAVTVRGPGHRLPQTLAALNHRDVLICEAVERFFSGASGHEAARRLHQALERYACGAWRRERSAPECPARHIGRLTAFCWHILRAVDHVPSARTIRFILSPGIRCPRGMILSSIT